MTRQLSSGSSGSGSGSSGPLLSRRVQIALGRLATCRHPSAADQAAIDTPVEHDEATRRQRINATAIRPAIFTPRVAEHHSLCQRHTQTLILTRCAFATAAHTANL